MSEFKNIEKHQDALTKSSYSSKNKPAKIVLAITIAVFADILSIVLSFAPEFAIPANMLLVATLSLLLGFKFVYLPAAMIETFPFLSAMPFWTAATLYSIYRNKQGTKNPAEQNRTDQ